MTDARKPGVSEEAMEAAVAFFRAQRVSVEYAVVPENVESQRALALALDSFRAPPTSAGGAGAKPVAYIKAAKVDPQYFLLDDEDRPYVYFPGHRDGDFEIKWYAKHGKDADSVLVPLYAPPAESPAKVEPATRVEGEQARDERPPVRPFHDIWQHGETGRLLELPMHAEAPLGYARLPRSACREVETPLGVSSRSRRGSSRL